MSFLFEIGRKRRKAGRFIGHVRRELLKAFLEEQDSSGLNRDELAKRLDVHKSVITRRLNGSSNLTLRVVAEMADALGRDIEFRLDRPVPTTTTNWYVPDDRLSDTTPPPETRVTGLETNVPELHTTA